MKQVIPICCLLAVLVSCQHEARPQQYPLQVGDIDYDPKLDDPSFELCNDKQVPQYYNFGKGVQYQGEKPAINKHFESLFNYEGDLNDSGFITIRFIVNCKGKTGRFRIQQMDFDYQEKKFRDEWVPQLVERTKQMSGWEIGQHNGSAYDYYQYLTFKIEKGKLIEIMP